MDETPVSQRPRQGMVATFGPFRLFPDRRILLLNDEPLPVGSRALEILIALTDRCGEVVTKDELFARVWPNATVEESNLRAQVALLRKALGDDHAAARYIAAVPGRGYRFVAQISRSLSGSETGATDVSNNLPRQLTQPIGRDEAVKAVCGRFQRSRLTTVVGPGGIGKTTLARAVAERLLASYEDGVCFVDLAPLTNAELLPGVLSSGLGLAHGSADPLRSVIAHLRARRMLLIFDSCEPVVETAARMAEMLLRDAPGVHILATSREALRAEGESVYRLAPLEMPPVTAGLTAAEALAYPAVRLFVDRATSHGSGFRFDDHEAPIVADICRQLDGIALAIELAAGRVEAFGTRGVAKLLDDRFRLLTGGRRTALARHRTLSATLDWSYEALSDAEQTLLRRLAVFAGEFTLEAVLATTSDAGDISGALPDLLANLVAKSLVAADAHGPLARYRLLDTTRAYALAKLSQRGERAIAVRRVADYLCATLKPSHGEVDTISGDEWLARYGRHINNVRIVLDWAYSPEGDPAVGVALTIAAIPLWYQMSLVDECLGGVQRALSSIGSQERRDAQAREVMQLYRALGLSQAFKVGFAPQAPAAFTKALEIAERLGDPEAQLEALWGLWLSEIGVGENRAAHDAARRFMALAGSGLDRFIGHRMVSMTLFVMGDHRGAREHADRMLAHDIPAVEASSASPVRFRFGPSVASRIQPAQLLWIQGFPEQAMMAARDAVDAAEASGHAISHCDAIARWACPVLIQVGDLVAADAAITTLLDQATASALGPWQVIGRCWKGTLLIKEGLLDRGIPLLQAALGELQQGRLFTLYNVKFLGVLAEGLATAGQMADGRALVDSAIRHSEDEAELWCIAELLRIKGDILLRESADLASAEACYMASIDWAQRQDALSWELQATMSLARLKRARGEIGGAHHCLAQVYRRFCEGFETADLIAARDLLARLS
jgi:predicted ATPase/DNA-binding winged helix-turn-helix (wHTH) protein